MSCYSPIRGYRSLTVDPVTGKRGIVFSPQKGFHDLPMEVPCGKCLGCRTDHAKEWAVRCVKEAGLHKENCFLTLTYAPEKMPLNESLEPRNFTLFLKKLRKKLQNKIRFFQCGEYGTKMDRPHHHCIIFGWTPPDLKLWRTKGNVKLFRSEIIENTWNNGFCTVGFVTFESVYYVSRYLLKKSHRNPDDYLSSGKHPEYITMSRRPGIGHEWIKRFHSEVYNDDTLVYGLGQISKPPRYFDKYYQSTFPDHFREIQSDRLKRERDSDYNSTYRLNVRRKLQENRLRTLVREIH